MNLGLKFGLSLVIPLVGLTVAFGYIYQQRSQALLREELEKEGRAIALLVQIAAEDYLRDRQPADLRNLVDQITNYERVLGIRIFDRDGAVVYQSSSLHEIPFQHQDLLREVLRERRSAKMRRLGAGGESLLGFLFPLTGRGGRLEGAGQILQLEAYIEDDSRANRDFILSLTLAMVTATAIIIYLVTRHSVTRPIAELVHSFRQAGPGALPARAPVRSQDELGRLALEFNRMCDRLESAQQSLAEEQRIRHYTEGKLRNAQRLAGLGRLAAGLAHEIGTPLNVIGGRARGLQRQLGGDVRTLRSLEAISEQCDRIVRIVHDMLDFARAKPPRHVPTSIPEVVSAVHALVADDLARRRVDVQVAIDTDLPGVMADPEQLQQVVHNIVLNARDAMPHGGSLRVLATQRSHVHPQRGGAPCGFAVVRFEDTGTGIAPEHREHVFDPFFTTKEPGEGMGLGLAVSYGIVEEHGGWIDVESEVGVGTVVVVHLPVLPVVGETPDRSEG